MGDSTRLPNAEFYNSLQFQFLRKHENHGYYGRKCLICNRIFRGSWKSTLISHRKVCKQAAETYESPVKNEIVLDDDVLNVKMESELICDENEYQQTYEESAQAFDEPTESINDQMSSDYHEASVSQENMKHVLCGTVVGDSEDSDIVKNGFQNAAYINERGRMENIAECKGCGISLYDADKKTLQKHQ